MLFITIASIFFIEPIPKTAYEGSIAVVLEKPEPGLLILTPSGQELKRVSLKELKGRITSVCLGRNNNCALIATIDHVIPKDIHRGYFIDLAGKAKPKILLQKEGDFSWVLNREAVTIYYSENDPRLSRNQNDVHPQQHWQLDLKSGAVQKIDLPANHAIIDIAHDDDLILTKHWPGKTYAEDIRAGVFSTKTWKPTYLSTEWANPKVMSPDGRYVLALEKERKKKKGPGMEFPMTVIGIKTRVMTSLIGPEVDQLGQSNISHTFGTNNRIAIISDRYHPSGLPISQQRIFVLQIDGSKSQIIYEPKTDEVLVDCDWR